MKINLAKSAGFCFGVKRAIGLALHTAASGKKVYMLGEIVHNEDVVRQIKRSGIRIIKKLPSSGKHKIFLIRAHGSRQKTIQTARRLHYAVADATCPMVKEIHRIAQNMEKQGYRIIVIGDKLHDEVMGIIGQIKGKAIVIDDQKNIPWEKIKKLKRACVVVQSTQNMEKVMWIVAKLKSYCRDIKFFNTICQPTRLKQQEIKTMPRENDVMIIIGSKHSANTQRLFEISKAINPRSYWVNRKADIRRGWFKGAKSVGITAGASTPDYTTKEVIAYIKKIA